MAGQRRKNLLHYNQPLPLADYLVPLVGDKKEVKIADIGSGPYSKLGNTLDGVDVKIYASDGKNFDSLWKSENLIPLYKIAVEDMEHLTYEDDFFDIVVCNNALDHTKDAFAAMNEMVRVTKPGGWVRIDCNLNQMDTGYRHFWNAKEDGKFFSKTHMFDLKDFGFSIEFIDLGGESRYNRMIATLQKGL